MNQFRSALSTVMKRRSIGRLSYPAPDEEQLHAIIRAGMSAPDHGRLRPWRFVVFEDSAREKFGAVLATALRQRLESQGLAVTEMQLSKERNKLLRAPCVIAVCAVLDHENRIPVIEQFAATAAACENMLIAATALGFGSMWRTGDPSYDPSVKYALGLKETDMITGWIYVGTAGTTPLEKEPEESVDPYVSHWS